LGGGQRPKGAGRRCKGAPARRAGAPIPVAPYQQGYIKGIIIAQNTFNNQRVRESYNYVYYSQTPCDVYNTLTLSIER